MKIDTIIEGSLVHSVGDALANTNHAYIYNLILCRSGINSLDGIPSNIPGRLELSGNDISDLNNFPERVGGAIQININMITSLKHMTSVVNDHFNCGDNLLTSLEYGPIAVNGDYNCFSNKLTSLKFIAKTINGNVSCGSNKITSLIGIDDLIEKMHGLFSCAANPIREGGLGLLLIPGFIGVAYNGINSTKSTSFNKVEGAFAIIEKHCAYRIMKNYDDSVLYDCHYELVERGFEEFAQL